MKKALITGITGQDGSYLAELLLSKGYEVHGIIRRASTFNTGRINHICFDPHDPKAKLFLHFGDLSDAEQINNLIYNIKPDEIYHLGAQSVAEECLCPILSAQKVDYRTLGNLWDEQVKKSKRVKIENINGTRIELIDLSSNTQLKALGMWNGMGTWFPIKQISRHWWKGKVIRMSQKFGSVTVTPNHSVLDLSQRICRPEDNPWLLNVRKLNYKPNKYKNSISLKLDGAYKSDNSFFWLEEKGIPGKVLKIIKEDKIRQFCRFVGAFIAEGHTSYNIANGNWYVGISSSDKKWLEGLGADIKSFYNGKYWYVRHKKGSYKDVWELQIKSRSLYNLLRKLLGTDSKTKKLPYWFSQIKKEYLREIWKKMLEGDGCIDKKCGFRYTTSSYKLACQLSWLFTDLGYDYTVNEEVNGLSIFWHFRECTTYQPYQGEKDKKIMWIDYNGWVYDITVDGVHNFAVGVGNIIVHNSHVRVSFDIPEYTGNVTALGTARILEAIRRSGHKIKLYNASSSEMFGAAKPPQNEETLFMPRSPYACAKAYAYWMAKNYRDGYNIFASNGILFNHESPRRGETFVTRKITRAVASILAKRQNLLYLGNLEAKRDWGFAPEYVEIMWKILQQSCANDFVIGNGHSHSVKDFVKLAFDYVGLNWRKYVKIDSRYFRPTEVGNLVADTTKAKKKLNWSPKITLFDLVKIMVDADMRAIGLKPVGDGDKILEEKFPKRWWKAD